MENYLENYKKHNKTLFKYLGYTGKDVDYKDFNPHDSLMGFEILRWVIHKISHNPREGYKMKVLVSIKDAATEVLIQEWHNTSKPDGFVNVVYHSEVCDLVKEDVSKEVYEEAIINTSHRAAYNACVDYIIKTS